MSNTSGTADIARRLARRLGGYKCHLVAVNEHSASDMRATVEAQLRNTLSHAVGLNYTGGTKFMAVHTYQAVEEFCKRGDRELVLSYLHAEGYPAGEMKHGPIALIDENMPVVFVSPRGGSNEKILEAIQAAWIEELD